MDIYDFVGFIFVVFLMAIVVMYLSVELYLMFYKDPDDK